jgi:non-ribosomal peptide synthetase-like protein
MVPSYLETIDTVPMLPSGKADRGKLPAPSSPRLMGGDKAFVAPSTPTEHAVAEAWERTLKLPAGSLSIEADLFQDLGGHSLLAATIVSRLRAWNEDAGLSILDIYANPSVRTLAELVDERLLEHALLSQPSAAATARPAPPRWWRVAAFAVTQLSWVYVLLTVFLLPIGAVYALNDGEPSVLMLQQMILTVPISYLIGRWVVPLVAIRLAQAGMREGEYPMWGWVHLRVWAAQKSMTLSPLNRLAGSPWAEGFLRLAGAKVGEGCHIGTALIPLPRFVRFGDGATIGYGTHLESVEIADGVLRIGLIDIGADAYVGASAVVQGPSSIGERALLREQSLLRQGQHIPAAQTWSGSPAEPMHTTGDPVLDLMTDCPLAPRAWTGRLRGFFLAGLAVLEAVPLLALAPVVALVWWALLTFGEVPALAVAAASGPVFVVSACALVLFLRRFALVETPVGIHHLRSQLGVEKWFGDKLLEISLELTNSMYATLYTSTWMRMLGAKVGRRAEISTIANIDPDMLDLADECFIADMASVGSATYCNGHVAFRQTQVGRKAFVGNASFIPSGTHLGAGSLIGVQSVPPVSGVAPDTSWLGSPPIYLPRRETYDEFTEEETFRPSRSKVAARYVIEFFRSVLPASILSLSTFATLYALSYVADAAPWWIVVPAAPALALLASLGVVLVVAIMKWLIVGRYRPRVEPLWSNFVRRTEFVTGIYEGAAVPVLLATVSGTPLLGPLLRIFGTHIGRRALVDTTYLTEFDLVYIGDDAVVGTAASLQTHLFEDRVMKMGEVRLEPASSVGSRAVVLYGSSVGEQAMLAPLSLVMKGESLPARSAWAGIPAQPAVRGYLPEESGALATSIEEVL